MNWHIVPVNDKEEHQDSISCRCNPKVDDIGEGNLLILHNSFDGREIKEDIKRRIDNKTNLN